MGQLSAPLKDDQGTKMINRSRIASSGLALNGAPPAFDTPLHVGRPNIGNRAIFLRYANQILDDVWLTNNGPLVRELEERIAEIHNVNHCVAMTNGTIGLEIAIRALGLTGEVIVPSYTFVATAHALQWQGITPVFADINPKTHNLDPASVRRMITPKTTGIIGVHLWGRGAPVVELQSIADEHGLQLLFDAAHAFGCSLNGRMIGGFGRAEVLSFHATKFFNSFEGGAVLTNDDELADAMRLMRNFGFSGNDEVIYPGTNGKMAEICAAMGLTNLDSIQDVISINKRNYLRYQAAFSRIRGVKLLDYDVTESNNFQYIVAEVNSVSRSNRDEIVAALQAENVLVRKYFWPGCHRMSPYRELYPQAGYLLPETEKLAAEVIVFPTGTGIDEESIDTIASIVAFLAGSSS